MLIERGERRLLNLLPVRAGGGLQNATSFLRTLHRFPNERERWTVAFNRGIGLEKILEQHRIEGIATHRGPLKRILQERELLRQQGERQVCLTLFGPPPFGAAGRLLSVSGFAYSNLLYPEVPFWSSLTGVSRLQKEAVDAVRRWSMAQADAWIFETSVLRERAVELADFPSERCFVVQMSPGVSVGLEHVSGEIGQRFHESVPTGFRCLVLAGAHPNKRQHLLPAIARWVRSQGIEVVFVTTMDSDNEYARAVMDVVSSSGQGRAVTNVGPVSHQDVASLISTVDAVAAFGRLESFSNNYVEAWRMRKPLLVTDADWSRSICGGAALYVDPERPSVAGAAIVKLAKDSELRSRLVAEGEAQLERLPSQEDRVRGYLEVLSRVLHMGPLEPARRRRIRWPRPTAQ